MPDFVIIKNGLINTDHIVSLKKTNTGIQIEKSTTGHHIFAMKEKERDDWFDFFCLRNLDPASLHKYRKETENDFSSS